MSILSFPGDDQQPFAHAPDSATALVFRTGADRRSDLLVMGPRTRASYHVGKHLPVCVKIRIRPGRARALLGVSISALTDRVVPLDELWGAYGERLAGDLARLGPDPELVLARLQAELRVHLAARTPEDLARSDLLRTAARALTTGTGHRPEQVRALAERLAISERQLRNLFTDGVGLSPKHLARIERVRSALARLGQEPRAQLAADTGYYDQSHMTAEFRALMGTPPQAFQSGRLPPIQPCKEPLGKAAAQHADKGRPKAWTALARGIPLTDGNHLEFARDRMYRRPK
ncbi:transcriptional activator FtrA [Streptomyces sp. YIM 130001]|nr:transcriptional activator FtrA [Streptomyces sp. YIM 130001]